jgi:hypothetical protein
MVPPGALSFRSHATAPVFAVLPQKLSAWRLLALGAGPLLLLALPLAGCAGSEGAREKLPPDQRYGHRYEGEGPAGRQTLRLTEPEPGRAYNRFPVPVDSVVARAAPFEEGAETVPVELLIKGALPNRCLSLAEAQPERDGHFLNVAFQMRWPTGPGAGCARYERPYRFYLPLEGRYEPGDYTLKLNGTVYPFSIRRE